MIEKERIIRLVHDFILRRAAEILAVVSADVVLIFKEAVIAVKKQFVHLVPLRPRGSTGGAFICGCYFISLRRY